MVIREGAAEPSASDTNSWRQSPGSKLAYAKPQYTTVQMKLEGSRAWKDTAGLEPTGGVSNYIRGNDAKDSLNGIPHYARLSVSGVYDGVDLVFYSNGGDLEYDFVVAPGADPKQIRLAFDGQERMRVDEKSGDLVLTTAGGSELRQVRPQVYQQLGNQRVEVAGGYQLLDHGRAAFTLASYQHQRSLVIDPTVKFSLAFNHGLNEDAYAVAVDFNGNSYITGRTSQENFPVTDGSKWLDRDVDCAPFSFCAYPYENIFVAKLSPAGVVLFATYGGAGQGSGIALDSTGVYVTGSDFKPILPGQVVVGHGGGSDLFVLKLSFTGTVIYRNGVGGDGQDDGNAIAVDSEHNAWVAGDTNSPEFLGPGSSAAAVLVVKFGPTGTMLASGTFGGEGKSQANGIAVDPADQPWITGTSCGRGFPVTAGLFDYSPNCKAFVLQLERQTGTTRMSMVIGGNNADDGGTAIITNGSNTAYITGYVNSTTFPTTPGVYRSVRSSGSQAFVAQVDASSYTGRIVRATLLDPTDTIARAIAPGAGAIYVGGDTAAGGFVAKMSQDLSQLYYTKPMFTYVFGLASLSLALDSATTAIFVAGEINSSASVARLNDDTIQSQVLWNNPTTGQLTAWVLDGQGHVASTQTLSAQCSASNGCAQSWKVIGTLDSNHDGVGDVIL